MGVTTSTGMFASCCKSSNRSCDAVPAVPGVTVAARVADVAGNVGFAGFAGVSCVGVTSAPFAVASSSNISLMMTADVLFVPS
eukprot:2651763-Ditylum_brightwellii.AAC.1